MPNYVNGECNYTLHLFHKAVDEYFKEDGEAEKLVKNWKEQNKQLKKGFGEFGLISKEEVKKTQELLDFKKSHNNEIDLPFPTFLPVFTKCPHMATEIMCFMNDFCEYNIKLESQELKKKKK